MLHIISGRRVARAAPKSPEARRQKAALGLSFSPWILPDHPRPAFGQNAPQPGQVGLA